MSCPFCETVKTDKILDSELCFVRYDQYPVSDGHLLIIPKRHVADYFETTNEEKSALWKMVDNAKKLIEKEKKPNGYNIGINVGSAAGQTVFHLHIHLIPRYNGDMDDPRGGVRGVIPRKQKYVKQQKDESRDDLTG